MVLWAKRLVTNLWKGCDCLKMYFLLSTDEATNTTITWKIDTMILVRVVVVRSDMGRR